MNLILEKSINYKSKIKDFGVDPVNKKIITTGDKLIFSESGKISTVILHLLFLKHFYKNTLTLD